MPFKKWRRLALLASLLAVLISTAGWVAPVRAPLHGFDRSANFTSFAGIPMQNPVRSDNQYRIAKAANDPLQARQNYLKQIHAQEAWDVETSGEAVTIAVVDTGIDLNHPDLKANLVPGINLIQPKKPAQDDNGHGTNVAGVIAAVGNNDKGLAGLLWKAKIMPIKAMESDGTGDEGKLGEGIRYAVDHGAKIVVLSLGLNKPSDYLKSIIDYAENRGVLLVAAAGNEGTAVKYPAAYPTVLAVGGATEAGQADPHSNNGPELDLVAPWQVFTTELGGRYDYKDGTSLAAPQAAAVSALVWSKHPEMTPADIRSMLRQSAEDLGPAGWDNRTGFGLLRADRALQMHHRPDAFEPNDRPSEAKPIPLGKSIQAVLEGATDKDLYVIDAPYNGSIKVKAVTPTSGAAINVFAGMDPERADKPAGSAVQGVTIPVVKGKNIIMLKLARAHKRPVPYQLTADFQIYSDPYEDNNRQYKAYALAERSQSVIGTFSEGGDQDWYEMNIKQAGTLSLKLSTDTPRIDPVLMFQKEGEAGVRYDRQGEGKTEFSGALSVEPGTYYFRVGQAGDFSAPITGEYTFQIDLTSNKSDPNEPNDRAFQAVSMVTGSAYKGILQSLNDRDWFRFTPEEDRAVQIALTLQSTNSPITAQLYNYTLRPMAQAEWDAGKEKRVLRSKLQAGTYYIHMGASRSTSSEVYDLTVKTDK